MTKPRFSLSRSGELQVLFRKATLDLDAAIHRARDLAAQLEAELYLARLFGDGAGVRPQ